MKIDREPNGGNAERQQISAGVIFNSSKRSGCIACAVELALVYIFTYFTVCSTENEGNCELDSRYG